jgi:phosphate-selective porin OprO/OprP
MLRHSVRSTFGLAASVALFAALPATAEEPAAPKKSVTEQVLEILRAQGTIDDARYQDLKKQLEEEKRAQQPPPAEEPKAEVAKAEPEKPATEDPEGWKIYFKDVLRIERNDGWAKLHVGGMTQFDVVGISEDQDLKDEVGSNQGSGVQFRRARLSIDGDVGEHLIFKAEYDFAQGDADFADVWVGLQRLPYAGRALAGHFKEPMSLEEITSDRFITFMERALPVLAFSPARNSGVGIFNTAFEQRMTWGVGGFRDTNNFGDGFGASSPYDVTARITGLPVWQDEGRTLVHAGYSYSHRFRDSDDVDFDPRPEVNLSDPLIDTGDIPSNGVDVFGVELSTVLGPLSLQGEFLDALVNAKEGDDLNYWGAYGYASWFLTGESRAYDPRIGAFTRTSPKNPFSVAKGQWGGWELAGRYSYVNLDDGDFNGGEEDNITAAVNWYLYGNFRIMLNYVWAHREGVGNQNAVMTRFSLDF